MQKQIIIVSGSPSAKRKLSDIIRKNCWLREVNPKKSIREGFKLFYWDGESDVEDFVQEHLNRLNEKFDYENRFIDENVRSFWGDDDEYKNTKSGRRYENYALVLHGVSKNIVKYLQDEYGAFKIHVSRREYHTVTKTDNDVILLYEDDESFEGEVEKLLGVLFPKRKDLNNE